MKYDGSITIDTKIDTKSFDAGVKNMSGKVGGVLKAIQGMGTALGAAGMFAMTAMTGGLLAAIAIIGGAFAALTSGFKIAWKSLGDRGNETIQEIKNRFEEVKVAFANVFIPIFVAALPYIKSFLSWLIQVLNQAAMITAAFMGQKEALQVIEGSVQAVAKNMEKTTKSAKGALAAFDQINVLNSKTTETPELGDVTQAATELVPVTGEILTKVSKIKQWFIDAWNWIVTTWGNAKEWFLTYVWNPLVEAVIWYVDTAKKVWGTLWKWLVDAVTWYIETAKKVWGTLLTWMGEMWGTIKQWAGEAWEGIKETWKTVSQWFRAAIIEPLRAMWNNIWDFIKILANNAWATIKFLWSKAKDFFREYVTEPLKNLFNTTWTKIIEWARAAWNSILHIWSSVTNWFSANVAQPLQNAFGIMWDAIKTKASEAWTKITGAIRFSAEWARDNIIEPIKSAFDTALTWVRDKWNTVFTGIINFIKGIINQIIGALNNLLDGVVTGINTLISGANRMGEIIPGWIPIPSLIAPQIPYLASGAVIPPNAEFLAVLGDQRNGRNIEAPESLIRQIVSEEIGKVQAEITVNFSGSLAALVRELRPYIERENVRVGSSLIKGNVTL